jgi:DNA-binding NarL/FixJ family response regulator
MAHVIALIPDLMFGSRVQSSLTAAGHDVELIGDVSRLKSRLADSEAPAAEALVVDLTDDAHARARAVRSLPREREPATTLESIPTLAFYSHVDTQARIDGEEAGFDLVVPRSRMAREGAELVARLLSAG